MEEYSKYFSFVTVQRFFLENFKSNHQANDAFYDGIDSFETLVNFVKVKTPDV